MSMQTTVALVGAMILSYGAVWILGYRQGVLAAYDKAVKMVDLMVLEQMEIIKALSHKGTPHE